MGADRVITVGVAAHITAASPGGPRYDESLTSEERRSHANGVWLCSIHARLIDVDEVNYPVGTLRSWKDAAENRELGVRTDSITTSRSGWFDDRLLERLPPPVAAQLLGAVESAPELVQNLSQWIGNPEDRAQNIRALLREPPGWLVGHAPLGWSILAELADAHSLPEAGAFYRLAAEATASPSARLSFQVSACLADSRTDLPQARASLRDLLAETESENGIALVRLVLGALDQDFDAVMASREEAMGVSERSDFTAQHFVGQVLRARGDLDGAIRVFESLVQSGRGGVRLLLATTLVVRGTAEESFTRAEDCLRARSIALEVRDERRRWNGTSAEAALIAVQAAAALDDWSSVIQIGSAVEGDATPEEAVTPELVELVGVGAIFEGRPVDSELSGASPSGQAWLRGMQYRHEAAFQEQAVAEFTLATEAATNPLELERALRGLAMWGVQPLPRLAELRADEPEHATALDALARYRSSQTDENLSELRRLASDVRMAAGFLALIESERGNDQLSAQIALDAADRFGDSALIVQAVSALFEPDPVMAARIARERVDGLPQQAPARLDLRRALLDLALRTGDPSEVLRAASEAVADGVGGDRAEWLAVDALRVLGRGVAAWDRIAKRALRPTSEREAQVFLAIQAEAAPSAAEDALAVLDQFSSSHDVLATGLLLFLGRQHDGLDDEVGRRFGAHLQRFTALFPESPAIRKISVDPNDPAATIAAIQQEMPVYTDEAVEAISRVTEELQLGRLPVGACAAILRRSPLVLLVSGRFASVPHVAAPDRFVLELPSALEALDAEAVVDLTALSTGSLVNELWDLVRPLISRAAIASSQLADAKDFGSRAPAAGYMVPTPDGVTFSDVSDVDQAAMVKRAGWIAETGASLAVEVPPMTEAVTPIAEIELDGNWAHALHLAKTSGRVLIADDPALLELARLADVKATSSVGLLMAAAQANRVELEARDRVLMGLVDAGVVDLPIPASGLTMALETLGWPEQQAMTILSRSSFWQLPNAVEAHHRIARGVAGTSRHALAGLAAASVLGVRRTVTRQLVAGFAGAVLAQLLLAADATPEEVPEVLAGARANWQPEDPNLVDVLTRTLRDLLSELVPAEDVARFILGLMSELSSEEREAVRRIVFTAG